MIRCILFILIQKILQVDVLLKYIRAKECEKCGYLASKKCINTITYAKCPH